MSQEQHLSNGNGESPTATHHSPCATASAGPPIISATGAIATPAFVTELLRVFRCDIKPTNANAVRAIYLGFLADTDWPAPVVVATVWINCPYVGNLVDWLETVEGHRRSGLATDLWHGLKKSLGGQLYAHPVTKSGKGFARSLGLVERPDKEGHVLRE